MNNPDHKCHQKKVERTLREEKEYRVNFTSKIDPFTGL